MLPLVVRGVALVLRERSEAVVERNARNPLLLTRHVVRGRKRGLELRRLGTLDLVEVRVPIELLHGIRVGPQLWVPVLRPIAFHLRNPFLRNVCVASVLSENEEPTQGGGVVPLVTSLL